MKTYKDRKIIILDDSDYTTNDDGKIIISDTIRKEYHEADIVVVPGKDSNDLIIKNRLFKSGKVIEGRYT